MADQDTRLEYVPEFGRAVRILEIDRPMQDDDTETAQTVTYMDELAAADANQPAIAAATAEALELAGIGEQADAWQKAEAVFWWLKKTVRYVPTPGTSRLVDQTLITPCAMLAMPEPIGDCPQFSMLAAAMFRVLCMDSMFVTIKADERDRSLWSHIYNTVEVAPGQYLPFDSSNGPSPGAEYAKPFKRRVWPRVTSGRCRTKETAADMLRPTQSPGIRRGVRNQALRGSMGDYTGYTADYGDTFGPPGYSDYGIGGGGWNDILKQAAGAAIAVGVPIAQREFGTTPQQQRPYYVSAPSGQSVLYDPNTGRVSQASNIASAVNPQLLTWGIAAIAAVVVLSAIKK